MISLGLTAAQQQLLVQTLAGNHSVFVRVSITDFAGNRISEISDRMMSGQVDMDASQAVSRTCLLTMLDPAKSLSFDSDSPEDGALWHDRMIKVQYEVHGPLLANWVSIPLFHGYIVKLSRDDAVVSIEAQGKELFGLDTVAWNPYTFKKGANRVQCIRDILTNDMGETKFTFPETSGRLPKDYSLGKETHPWHAARSLGTSENCALFYDGRGVAVLRRKTANPIFTFTDGDGGTITSSPKVAFSSDGLKNVVWVKGGVPAGGKKAVEWTEAAPATNPMSPARLGRNGVPRYMLESITEDTLRTTAEAKALAQSTLAQALLQQVDVSFDAMVNPLLEEWDTVRIATDEFNTNFVLTKFTIPLVVDDSTTMSIGYNKRVVVNKGKIRR